MALPLTSPNLQSYQDLLSETIRHLLPKGWQVHILTDDYDILSVLNHNYKHENVTVVDYRLAEPGSRSKEFLDRYIHQSVNAVEYERFCL